MPSAAIVTPPKIPVAELDMKASIPLHDEQSRLWGFYLPLRGTGSKHRSPREWYILSRTLLAEQSDESLKPIDIVFEEEGRVVGQFHMSPWSDIPPTVPAFSDTQIADWHRMSRDNSRLIEFDELNR